ncbi:hypothetical protein NQ315_005224 [Exocentrus adspersus]|uniref:Phospholipase A2 n=1 Tax=Exocentrus adspersus TaxID=1586481 RepID=A0AAV8W2T0_9CUCU|nr:hypothetical protein NQ315_005224 [Exocentrus adspersus]
MPMWTSKENLPDVKNASQGTMLVSFSSNMFEPSVIIKPPLNSTSSILLKGHSLRPPNPAKIKFHPVSIKHSDYTGNGASSKEQRKKRGVLHLYNMVSCATGCNPLIYKGYGCYCGFLGSGYPVDGIDSCCKRHDWCYNKTNCPTFLEYFVPYFWKCYYNHPLCAIDHGEYGGPGSCASRLCECDRILSECLSHYPCPSTRALCRSSPLRLLQNAFMIYP